MKCERLKRMALKKVKKEVWEKVGSRMRQIRERYTSYMHTGTMNNFLKRSHWKCFL